MAEKIGQMREQIEMTKGALTEDIATLEDQLKGKVESVKDELHKITPSHQVQQNPLWALGGAVVAGAAIGGLIGSRRTSSSGEAYEATPEPKKKAAQGPGPFDEEWKLLKGVLLGAVTRNLGKVAQKAVPSLKNEIEEVINRVATKVETGTPIGRPHLAETPANQEWAPGGTDSPTAEGESKSYH